MSHFNLEVGYKTSSRAAGGLHRRWRTNYIGRQHEKLKLCKERSASNKLHAARFCKYVQEIVCM